MRVNKLNLKSKSSLAQEHQDMQLIDSIKPTELAEQIGVTESTLATWRCRNKGPRFVRIAGRIHYMRADVEAWIAEQVAA
ncbi:helix-turn-helix domain-containing protein [Corynebacterium sp. MSK195]|nr:helix-turn-helix domain-containing protein [Corynebacterium sp. MSK195]MDK8670271.1 DNA-binding protein [Corynebacterium sp. MSK195]